MTVAIVFLVGCDSEPYETKEVSPSDESRFSGIEGEVTIITDSETNCKYIYLNHGISQARTEGISPLMKDSTHVDCD